MFYSIPSYTNKFVLLVSQQDKLGFIVHILQLKNNQIPERFNISQGHYPEPSCPFPPYLTHRPGDRWLCLEAFLNCQNWEGAIHIQQVESRNATKNPTLYSTNPPLPYNKELYGPNVSNVKIEKP